LIRELALGVATSIEHLLETAHSFGQRYNITRQVAQERPPPQFVVEVAGTAHTVRAVLRLIRWRRSRLARTSPLHSCLAGREYTAGSLSAFDEVHQRVYAYIHDALALQLLDRR
jgi:hypothetical protein